MAFDYEAARAGGYSDAEIADYLAKESKFDIQGARKSGYSSEEILGHLAPAAGFEYKKPTPAPGAEAGSARYGTKSSDQQTEYEQGKTSNPFHGAIARAANIAGEGIEGVARMAESAGDFLERKIPLSGLTEEQIANERQLEPLFKFAQSAKNWSKSIGYEPGTKLNELSSNPLKTIPFIAERLITSSPDMAAAVMAAPAYFTARTNEILNDRIKNDEKTLDDITIGDVTAAAGAAGLELTLERFATKHILKGAPITGKNAYTRVGKELAFQSGTEGLEEGVGYLGGAAGTKKGVDPSELSQQMLEGAIVGGGLGGAVKGTQEYYDYRQKKKAALMAEGVDEDIADKTIQNMDAQRDSMEQATVARREGETDLKKLSDEYFGREYGEEEAPAAPIVAETPAPTVEPAPANPFVQGVKAEETAAPEITISEEPLLPKAVPGTQVSVENVPVTKVTYGQEKVEPAPEVILQNRDRSTPASVNQMQDIATNPDYNRLKTNAVVTSGAPIVFGAAPIAQNQFGKQETVSDELGNRYPMQYAVVEADEMMPSNNADGSKNQDYATFQGLRAIGGNGRLAGLQEAYQRGTADTYRTELTADTLHGIDPEVIAGMNSPVLVRLMDPSMIDENTADNFNITGTAKLPTVDQAINDTRRVDFSKMETDEKGRVTPKSIQQFINSMPQSELTELIDKRGEPTQLAMDRFEAAIFQQAYKNPELVAIAFESKDAEARNIIKALSNIAPKVMQLEGTDYDIREDLMTAVDKAITARRDGTSLEDATVQMGLGEGPLVQDFMQVFRDNPRSAKAMTELLGDFVDAAYEESVKPEGGLFGETPRRTVEQLKEKLAPEKAPDLFAEEAKPAKTAEEIKEDVARRNTFNAMSYLNGILQSAQEGYEVAMSEEASGKRGGGRKTMRRVHKYLMEKLTPILGKKDAKKYADYLVEEDGLGSSDMGTNHELYEIAVGKMVERMEMKVKGEETMAKMKESFAKTVGKSLWKNTEYADRIDSFLTDLRNAGDEQYATMLDNAFSQDASKGPLKESGVAFREEAARKRIVELSAKGEAQPVEFNPMTTDKLARIEQGIGKLPVEIQNALADTWNKLAPEIYKRGYRYSDVNSASPEEVRSIKDKIAEAFGSVLRIAGQRYMSEKGYKTYNADKHAKFEQQASDLLGIDTNKYPGIDASERILSDGKVRNEKIELVGQERSNVIEEPVVKAEEPVAKAEEADVEGATDEAVAEIADDFTGAMASQEEGGWQDTHVFDPPSTSDVVRLDERVRIYHAEHGWMTPAQAKKQIAEWQKNVDKQGSTSVNSDKVVLSLFDLSGEWSKPWAEAGYQVYQFDIQDESTYTDPETGEEKMFGDVNNFSVEFFNDMFGSFEGNDVYAILAACPCTDFASSGARHFAAKDSRGQTMDSVELVHQTLRTIEHFKPQVWAIENPVGRIEKLTGLPPWRLSFNPNQFGDPYTKRTLLWGRFNANLPIAPVEPTEGSKMHRLYGGKSQATKNARSVTPEGFAYAFFQANNAVDHPVMAIANKYDRLDRELFVEGVNAGLTFEEMNTAVEDAYYFDLDDEQAAQNLIDAIAEKTDEESGNWSITLRQPLNNAKNQDIRDEQISELQSMKQRMAAIQRRFAKAKLEPLDESTYAALHRRSAALREAIKESFEPNVTPEKFLAQAAKHLADDSISKETFDVVDFMYKKYPNVLDGLRLSVRKGKGKSLVTQQLGSFGALERIVSLFKGTEGVWDPSTIRHELSHSLEQMMTKEARERVVNAWRDKLLRATKAEKTEQGKKYFEAVAKFLENPSQENKVAAIEEMPNTSYYQYLTPSEFWAVNAEKLLASEMGGPWARFKKSVAKLWEGLKHVFGVANDYAIRKTFDQILSGERMNQGLLDDYFINTGYAPVFSISKRRNYEGGKPPEKTWTAEFPRRFGTFNNFLNKYKQHWFGTADTNWFETRIYNNVDKLIDLKRVQQAIGTIQTKFDAYMKETLYHGKVATRLRNFEKFQLDPLLKKMAEYGISKDTLNTYLHNRHAEEYNNHINRINPNAQMVEQNGVMVKGPLMDRGSGISTEDARAYLAGLDPKERKHLEELADRIDEIVKGTQDALIEGGIEKADTIKGWRKAFPKYVPLYRTELDFANTGSDIGRGFSTQAGFGKSATGSLKDVDDIFSNIAAQRERAIVRSEKAEVSRAIYALALLNPNVDWWLPVDPTAIKNKEKLYERLRNMGLEAEKVGENLIKEPEVPYIDASGMVAYRPNSIARNSNSVLAIPVDGETKYLFFNPSDARALRMVESLKNLDAKALDGGMRRLAMVTRWIAAVNTQYNPVFGLWNFWRDTQGAQLNLTSTPIAGQQLQVTKNLPAALRGIYTELRNFREGKVGKSEWAKLWNEFISEGGQTGYRDQFAKTEEQASIIDRKIKALEKQGIKHIPGKLFVEGVGGWMSDFNETMENAVRLSAYKVAKTKLKEKYPNMSDAEIRSKAAEIGKNLTVNFNRKGALSQNRNALYAFYNAAVQGTARMMETLTGPKGKVIMGTLLGLGVAQSLGMMMAGYDEDEPPEFIRERNLVIPLPDGQYAMWPMPLGFNALVNVGRIGTDILLNATVREGKSFTKKSFDLLSVATDAFNPLGSGNLSLQTLAPTAFDPIVAIATNKDAFGRPIYKEDQATNPIPGYLRARGDAFSGYTLLAEALNMLTGGTKYQKGMISPTPEEIAFIAGQATGGAGRELGKTATFFRDLYTGEETAPYKIPVAGRLYGDIKAQANVSNKFYENIVELANMEHEIKGRQKNKENVQEFLEEHPEAKLWMSANKLENQISKLKRLRKDAAEKENMDRVKQIDDQVKRMMDQFNRRVESAKGR